MIIIPDIITLVQHLTRLELAPEDYRPKRCPGCGQSGLRCHGAYTRKSNRRAADFETDEAIIIPRFLCPNCNKTCSSLPEAIPPSAALFVVLATAGSAQVAQRHVTQCHRRSSQTQP